MKSSEIRERFLRFFEKRGHAIIPSASLVTSDERGVTNPTLFNTAGMQPLIPYLLGEPHPLGKRLADSQKCVRTVDIDDIGDNTHATFFEMLGNWSLGDYFKEDAIKWSFEFLTNPVDAPEGERGLGLKKERLYVTVFEGDANATKDTEAYEIWKKYIPEHRIYFMSAKSNWWEAGDNGPCGPDSEMYYDVTPSGLGDLDKGGFVAADEKRDVVEIWNDVFMQYEKKDGKIIGRLPKPSVDTGAGLERLAMTLQGVNNIYDTDLLKSIMVRIQELSNKEKMNLKSARIIADHIRASVFLICDGVLPSNTDRGYVLRKLLRRAMRHANILGISGDGNLGNIALEVFKTYRDIYTEVQEKCDLILSEISKEEERFGRTLVNGLKVLNTEISEGYIPHDLTGKLFFDIFQNHGFPLELSLEELANRGRNIPKDEKDRIIQEFDREMKKHQELSRVGAEQKFKGGLGDANDEMVVRYHTATHLLHQALCDVLGSSVMQKGSNITPERLRFDFAHGAKMTDDEKKKVEEIVNAKIVEKLPVNHIEMSREDAEKTGSKHFFGEKYGDNISIYFIGDTMDTSYSKEFCGGPHVKNTSELAGPTGRLHFKILKEEAVAQGIRRIKAVLA